MDDDDIDAYVVVRIDGVPTMNAPEALKDALRGGLGGGSLHSLAKGNEVLDVNAPASQPKITVATTRLSDAQAAKAAEDPANVLARVFPVTPITMDAAEQTGALALSAAGALGQSWGLAAVGADADHLEGRGADVVVAILDSGIDQTHEAFNDPGLEIVPGNFAGDAFTDVTGHGTHCASIIFGRPVGGVRVGVAPAIRKALVARVFDDKKASSTMAINDALAWAFKEKANIVSMSLSFDFQTMFKRLMQNDWEEQAAFSEALARYRDATAQLQVQINVLTPHTMDRPGTLIVSAAGNQSKRARNPKPYSVRSGVPASVGGVLSVGAAGPGTSPKDYAVAPFSNMDPNILGPGVGIVAAKKGGGLTAEDGTSSACPHVAGCAALWWSTVKSSQGGFVRAEDVVIALRGSVAKLPGVAFNLQGGGLVRAPPKDAA